MNPWLGIAMVLACLGGTFLGLQQLGKRLSPHPEVLRKLMHVLMGLLAAMFPWIFKELWPVLLLSGLSLPALLIVRSGAAGSLQNVLHGVKRASWGELLFPIAVVLLFTLARDNALLYSLPILILAVADAVAALIGIFYGRIHYSTLEGHKSVEGSVAFLFVTFLTAHIFLLLFSDVGRLESLLIGSLIAVVVMMVEASAWRGLDNLFIPVSVFALLQTYLGMDVRELVLQLFVILALGIFVLAWRTRSTFDDSALFGGILVAYATWVLGDIYWLAVPVLMFVIGTWLASRTPGDPRRNEHTVYALLSVTAVSLVWLMIGIGLPELDLFFPYALGFGAHLVMLGVSREHLGKKKLALPSMLGRVIFPAWLIIMLPYGAMYASALPILLAGLTALVMLPITTIAFLCLQPQLEECPVNLSRWTRQALIASSVSLVGWLAVIGITAGAWQYG